MTPITTSLLGIAGTVLATCVILAAATWSALALRYRAPGGRGVRALCLAAWGAVVAASLAALWHGHGLAGAVAFLAAFTAVLLWWTRLTPTHEGAWADDVAQLTTGVVEGSRVTLHNVRNFDWRTTQDFTIRWETRAYDLDGMCSVDMIMSYWRGPAIAHLLMSFGFDGGDHVAFSVEIRRRKSQRFSELGGFFKQFEICVIAADELDVVRLRTNVRGERVHMYRLLLQRPAMRQLFLGYVGEANDLERTPRFYNTLTVNCTTLVYHMMKRIVGGLPFSYRLLFSGYIPEYVYAVGGLDGRFSLAELRAGGYVSDRGRESAGGRNFSADIRRGVPGVGLTNSRVL